MPYEMPDLSASGGIEIPGKELATQIPFFWEGILFLAFMVMWGAGYFSQERRVGAGNAAMWAAISALIATTAGFILFLYDGLVGLPSLVIMVVVTIIAAAAFIISERL